MIKKLLPLLLLILIGCSEPEPINMDEMLIERDDIFYTRDTNKPYSGPVFTLYENGQLEYERTLKNGKPDGHYKKYNYYENGQLKSEVTYKDGKRDGSLKTYHDNGQLKKETTYKDGKPDGSSKLYYENGQLESEITYKNGELIDSKDY